MSLFMERGVNQVERQLRILRPGLPEKAPLGAIVEAHQGDHDHQHGEHGHEQQAHVGHRGTKGRRVAVRERQSVGYHSSLPLWFLVGLEPSSFARIGHADQHRQGHEDREGDLDPSVGYQVHVHLLSLVFGNQPASSPS